MIAPAEVEQGSSATYYRKGGASLCVEHIDGATALTSASATDPMKILIPRPRGQSVWAYTSSFGGGMVAGDVTSLKVEINTNASCFLSTQASTKIYRNPMARPCSHTMNAAVRDNALLVFAPDPIQMFADSNYEQRQSFHLHASSNLVFLDWVSAGRSARGERWAFRKYSSRNELVLDGTRILLDSSLLDCSDGPLTHRFRGGRIDCYATIIMLGPMLLDYAKRILDDCNEQPLTARARLIFAASPLSDGLLLRVGGESVEEVGRWIFQRLAFVPSLLDDDPWARKW